MKGYLADVIPPLHRVRWDTQWYAVSRDDAYLLFIVLNELLLGVETTLAHLVSGTLRPFEWIPIIFGPVAGLTMVGALAARRKSARWAETVIKAAMAGSILVGGLGTYFHVVRAIRPFAPPGQRVTLSAVVWGVPLMAPSSFVLAGVLGFVALDGRLGREKDRAYFLLSSLGVLIATVSSTLDHLRGGFENPWLWIPVVSGVFGTTVAFAVGLLPGKSRGDLTIYTLAMLILMAVGPLGLILHVAFDLGVGNAVVVERFIRQAPVMAPMVFANYGLMGALALLEARSR